MGIPEALVMLAISLIVSYAMMPKAQVPKPAAFDEFEFPQSDEGAPQCVIFGECWTGDWMVLDVGNYRTTAIRKSSGGKK